MPDRPLWEWIADTPVPLVAIECPSGIERTYSKVVLELYIEIMSRFRMLTQARGVTFDRLTIILSTGCDVKPTNSVMYFADVGVSKALEYGCDGDQVLMLFRSEKLDRTFREVPVTIDPTELTALRKCFPTELKSRDGKSLWLSRLGPDDRRLGTQYESNYARWIPADPWEALAAVFAIGDDLTRVAERTRKSVAECTAQTWVFRNLGFGMGLPGSGEV